MAKHIIFLTTLFLVFITLMVFGLSINNKNTTKIKADSVAYFAGGCFWCIESVFDETQGVVSAVSGFSGGKIQNPTYKQVVSGQTKHRETVQINYNSQLISYNELLTIFFKQIDPTDNEGQFADKGYQYTTAIYYVNEDQKQQAQNYINKLSKSNIYNKKIVTAVEPFKSFYKAEEYHQDFYKKSSEHYKQYEKGSGRLDFKKYIEEKFIKMEEQQNNGWENYQKPSEKVLKQQLTNLQFKVTQKQATEPAFNNKYYNNTKEGIYVDILSGEPLFSSTDQFKSSTGWPSFTKPISNKFIVEKSDYKLFIKRTEVLSKYGNNHLGHVFNDGPQPTGLRYCINSASLKFIPKQQMQSEGYKDYLYLFN